MPVRWRIPEVERAAFLGKPAQKRGIWPARHIGVRCPSALRAASVRF